MFRDDVCIIHRFSLRCESSAISFALLWWAYSSPLVADGTALEEQALCVSWEVSLCPAPDEVIDHVWRGRGVSAIKAHLLVEVCLLTCLNWWQVVLFPFQKISSLSSRVTLVTWMKLCPLSSRYCCSAQGLDFTWKCGTGREGGKEGASKCGRGWAGCICFSSYYLSYLCSSVSGSFWTFI